MADTAQNFQLPLGVVTTVDVGRLLRELENLEAFMRSAEVRQPGVAQQPPKTSKLLNEFLEINKRTALQASDREELIGYFQSLRENAPTIHMSFSADPSPHFTQKIIAWLRENIHQNLLLQIGLQPTIGAGCIVRTTNKYFDFSLRSFMEKKRPLLMEKLHGTEKSMQAAPQPESNQESAPQPTPATAEVAKNEVQQG